MRGDRSSDTPSFARVLYVTNNATDQLVSSLVTTKSHLLMMVFLPSITLLMVQMVPGLLVLYGVSPSTDGSGTRS